MTLNEHWGYDKNDHHWKEAPEVIRSLVRVVGMGGNYLLNVGPTAQGQFPAESVRILNRVGQWMKTNSDSIYGTTACPLGNLAWGYCTAKPGKLFLHVLDWPRDGQLLVPGLRNTVGPAWLLADAKRKKLNTTRLSADDVQVTLPAAPTDGIDSVVVLPIEGQPNAGQTQTLSGSPGSANVFGVSSAIIHGKDAHYQGQNLAHRHYDAITHWRDPETWAGFRFRAVAPGSYKVLITYSTNAESANNEFLVSIGTKTFHEQVQYGLDQFETYPLGTLQIEPGTYEMTIKPKIIRKGSSMPDINAITLVTMPSR
jgi:alpha-L-fucosidase